MNLKYSLNEKFKWNSSNEQKNRSNEKKYFKWKWQKIVKMNKKQFQLDNNCSEIF